MGDDLRIVNAARVSFKKQTTWLEPVACEDCGRRFVSRAVARKFPCFKDGKEPQVFYPVKVDDQGREIWVPTVDGEEPLFDFEAEPWYDDHWHLYPVYKNHIQQKRLRKADAGIINAMMRERHGTPFETVVFTFHVRAPIGVVWEWVRHRISSFNVASTRYVEWEKDYFIPTDEDWRRQIGKAMAYTFEGMTEEEIIPIEAQYIDAMEFAFTAYEGLLDKGLAKEVARNVLPMGAMTEFYWTVNLRSLFNFLNLRTAPNALREIQIAARMVEELSSSVAPEAFAAWERHGRKAP